MPDDFYKLTWGEYIRISLRSDYLEQVSWDQTRKLISSFNGMKQKDIIFLPFFDDPKQTSKPTIEQLNSFPKTLNGK